jgi:hypothetical protein
MYGALVVRVDVAELEASFGGRRQLVNVLSSTLTSKSRSITSAQRLAAARGVSSR